jgi:hypothetical protein
VWQEIRTELHPKGLEVVTVALDTGGAEAAGEFIDRAQPDHPALIDQEHQLARLLGILNVPSGVWVDEEGTIVRPPETAFPGRVGAADLPPPKEMPPNAMAVIEETMKIRISPKRYLAALRDWAEHGADSRFALDPDEVVRRSAPRPPEASLAAAHFELAQHLHRSGDADGAVPHFAEARRLDPANWTYKRQAWSFADPVLQVQTGPYEGDWLSDIRELGPEKYYAPLDMPRD